MTEVELRGLSRNATLMKYLIDSLQSFETGHGNALHPIPLELDKSFMGEHTAMQHATGEDVRQIQDCVNRKFDELTKTITTKLSHTCHSLQSPTLTKLLARKS